MTAKKAVKPAIKRSGARNHSSEKIGVLVMAHGTPDRVEAIEPFYTTIRRGRPPTPELLEELVDRYAAIGGTSPLTLRTQAQVDGITAALDELAPGRYLVRYGAKYVSPTIEEAVAELVDAGVGQIIGIVLTPHQSTMGSGEYFERAERAIAEAGRPVHLVVVPSWFQQDGFAGILARRTDALLADLAGRSDGPISVFFTAHSLPQRVVAMGDPYPEQVAQSGKDIAELLDLDERKDLSWSTAWQSAGRTADPWIGPDLLEEMDRVAASGTTAVAVCPVGFVSDHLEVLFDLDIEAADKARELGIEFGRTPSLNDDPDFLALLATVVHQAVDQPPAAGG